VISNEAGSGTTSATIYDDETLYVDYGCVNRGSSVTGHFRYGLYVDGGLRKNVPLDSLDSGYASFVEDSTLSPLTAGTHTFKVVCDYNNEVTESDEDNNEYSRTFLIVDPSAGEEAYKFKRMWPTLQQPWYFDNPEGIAIDSIGNVYVVDCYSNRIQKFNHEGQFITAWGDSGTGDGEFLLPEGVAIDSNGNVYVVDSYNHRIQKFTADGNFIAKWGRSGIGFGEFNYPIGIAIDGSESVYIADRDNHRIQKFTTDGEFIKMWGSEGFNDGEFRSPHGIVIDSNGSVYVLDRDNHRVQQFTSDGGFIAKWGSQGSGDGEFEHPEGIAIDNIGNVCVADTDNDRIQKFTSDGQFITRWGSFGFGDGKLFRPRGIVADRSGNLYTADSANDRIQIFTMNGDFITKWDSTGIGIGQFNDPMGIAIDGSGNVYLADRDNNRIQKFTADGQFITQWGSLGFGDGEFIYPWGITIDGNGYVYVVDWSNHRIQKFTSDGGFIAKWGSQGAGDGEFEHPKSIAIDNIGNVYVADTENHRIQKFTSDGQFIKKWGSEGSGDGEFELPEGIAIDNIGNVYVADTYNHRIQKFTFEGAFITKWGGQGRENGQFLFPRGLTIDHSGNVNVADSLNDRIQTFTSDGVYVTEWGSTGNNPGQMNNPEALAVSSEGDVFLSDSSNHRIQVFKRVGVDSNNKAIIIAGGGPYPGNNIWDATQMCASYAYRALTYQGYSKDTIYYLSADTDMDLDGNGILDDVDADATNSNFQTAITNWAQDAEDLFIYMVDHGGEGTFRISATELVQASDLDTWVDTLQETIPGTVTIFYDACRSGTFIPYLTPPSGKERIILTSTSADEAAIFASQGTVSFSFLFWARMFNGDSFYNSLFHATNSIGLAYHQTPLIEANWNGIASEREDKEVAREIKIGNEIVTGGDIPVIGSVSPDQTLNGETSALIFAEDVIDADGISRVWAVITPPNYSSDSPDNPITDLPIMDLSSVGNNRYEATYTNFTTPGTYNISIFATDRNGVLGLPQSTTVTADDSDGDGVIDNQDNCPNTSNPNQADNDNDDLGDVCDDDDDNDGMPDAWENQHGLNPFADDASGDADGDGWSNIMEYKGGTDPNDATSHPIKAMPWIPLLLLDD